MPCPASGQISIQSLVDEFGGSAPHAMSEYYRNAGLVPSNNTSVPTSGEFGLTDCYSAVNEIQHTHSSNATDQNYATVFGSNWASTVPKRITINNGVTIGATGSNYAMTLPSGMGGTLIIDNAGTVQGYGGAAGGAGGTCIHVSSSGVTVNNTGTIQAGGGGGANGGAGGAGGDGSFVTESNHTGTSSGSNCSHYSGGWFSSQGGSNPIQGGGINSSWSGDQLCQTCHGGGKVAYGDQGSSSFHANQTFYNYQWGRNWGTGSMWNQHRYWKFQNQGCANKTTTNTTGGTGGSAGAGRVGQGYNQSAGSGAAGGSGGAASGTGAGAGGDGGAGGAGGAFGASGSAGSNGSTGANGNESNGAAGASAGSVGVAGHYVFKNGVTVTVNNSGTVAGQIN